ncbi:hypothetical protein L21SP4_01932 [Kiritimatiella glycovorans]|uniref:Uncharacterized protein n=2 Tax=Kiritimatiella glycovorans TaxID=1307763 RepID=A0A0G3EIA1_9BACT|nr:hypothetical protein L21SP4_01932 [Kiritimatiella glycovorans]
MGLLAGALIALLFSTPPARATETNTWLGGDGTWSDPAPWSLGVPSATQHVEIAAGVTVTCAQPANHAGSVRLRGGASLHIDSDTLDLSPGTGVRNLFVGEGTSTLYIAHGATLDSQGLDLDPGVDLTARIEGLWDAFGGSPIISTGTLRMIIGADGIFRSRNYTSRWGDFPHSSHLHTETDIFGQFISRIGAIGHPDADHQSITFNLYRGGTMDTWDRGLTLRESSTSEITLNLYGGQLRVRGDTGVEFNAEDGTPAGGILFHSTDAEMQIDGGDFTAAVTDAITAGALRAGPALDDYKPEASFDGTRTRVYAVRDSDVDGDGLPDRMETGTGTYRGPSDPGTDADRADSDGDGVDDYAEIHHFLTDPADPDDHPADTGAASPDRRVLEIPLEAYVVASTESTESLKSDSAAQDWPEAGELYARETFNFRKADYDTFHEMAADYPDFPFSQEEACYGDKRARLFLRFDLSALSTGDLAHIESACLRLHQRGRRHDLTRYHVEDIEIAAAGIRIARVEAPWADSPGQYPVFTQERTTWQTIGGYYEFGWGLDSAGFYSGDTGAHWVMDDRIEMTGWVADWIRRPAENHGLVVGVEDGRYAGVSCSIADDPATPENEAPALIVTFETQEDAGSPELALRRTRDPSTGERRTTVSLCTECRLNTHEAILYYSNHLRRWTPIDYDSHSACFPWWTSDRVPDFRASTEELPGGRRHTSWRLPGSMNPGFFRVQSRPIAESADGEVTGALPVGALHSPYASERVVDLQIKRGSHIRELPKGIPDAEVDLPYLHRRADHGPEFLFKDHLYFVRSLGGYGGQYELNSGELHTNDIAYLQDGAFYFDPEEVKERFDIWFPVRDELGVDQPDVQDFLRYTIVIDTIPWDFSSLPTPNASFGNRGAPEDMDAWYLFVHWLCQTLLDRYEPEFVRGLRFRIGSEARYTLSEGDEAAGRNREQSYLRYYDTTAAAIRDVLPEARIGPFNQMAAAELFTRYPTAGAPDELGTIWSVAEHCAGRGRFPQNFAWLEGRAGAEARRAPYDFAGGSWYKENSSVAELERDFRSLRNKLMDIDADRYRDITLEMMESDFRSLYREADSWETGAYGAAYRFRSALRGLRHGICGEWGAPEFEEIGAVNEYGDTPSHTVLGSALTGHGFVRIVMTHMEDGYGYILPVERTGTAGGVEALMAYFPAEDRLLIGVAASEFDEKPPAPDTGWAIPEEHLRRESVSIRIPALLIEDPAGTVSIRSTALTSNTAVYRYLRHKLASWGLLSDSMTETPQAVGGWYQMMGGKGRATRREDEEVNARINEAYDHVDATLIETVHTMNRDLLMLEDDTNSAFIRDGASYRLNVTVEFPGMHVFEIDWAR